MPTRPLRRILLRHAALVVGLPFLLIFILGVTILIPQVKKEFPHHQREMAAAVAIQVETYLESSRAMVMATAADIEMHAADGGMVEDYLLVAVLRAMPLLRAMYYVDGNGRIAAFALRDSREAHRRDLLGTDVSHTPLVKNVFSRRTEQWSDTYLSLVGGGIVVAVAVPSGKGVVVGELELDRLAHFLKRVETEEGLDIFVLDGRGQVISARDRNLSSQQLNFSNVPLVRRAMEGTSGTELFSFMGRPMLGSTKKLPAMNWSVLVTEPQAQLYRQVLTSGKIVAVGLSVALLLGLSLAFLFARTLGRRVEKLAEQAQLVASGAGQAQWPQAGIREYDNLASSLQKMSDSLHERALLLEQEIGERQRAEEELLRKNETLAAVEEELRHQVDELLLAQKELALREEELRTVADWTYDWEYWISPERSFRYISPSCARVSGYAPAEFMTDQGLMERIVHPDDRQEFCDHVAACLSDGTCSSGEATPLHFRIIAKDGTVHWIEHVCRAVFSTSGVFLGRRASNRDITERRLLEQQLLQQQKLESIGMLAGGIAHDFNNMLTPILGYADMIKAKSAPDDRVAHWASSILGAAEKAKNLVKQLLSFSRKQVLTVRRHDLNVIVEEFSDVLRRTIRENIEIRRELSSIASNVEVDRTQIEQILLNLAVNAQDAITEKGAISISTSHVEIGEEEVHRHPGARAGRYILLTFTDSGCGMDDTVLGHIFEPFFTTKSVGRGTGLGLSTTYGIIKQHSGFLDVISNPGDGTSFCIYFPESEAATSALPASPVPVTDTALRSGTILVVEDNPMVLEMMRDLLQNRGYRVLTASLPEEALHVVEAAGTIDLLVSDVVMPQMSGPEMYDRITLLLPGLKVLFVSGYASATVLPKGHVRGTSDFISKPFSSESLLQRVESLLGRGSDPAPHPPSG